MDPKTWKKSPTPNNLTTPPYATTDDIAEQKTCKIKKN